MKKLLATLLAVMMIATMCVVYVAAWSDGETDAGWTRHSVFDAKLLKPDGSEFEYPEDYTNGWYDTSKEEGHVDCFQLWKASGHLYKDVGLNVFNNGKIQFNFKGTGIRIGTCYRRPFEAAGYSAEDLVVTVDGVDKSASLKDVASEDDNNTAHTIIFEATGLEAGEHVVEFSKTTGGYRYSIDYYEIKDEGKEAPKSVKFKKLIVYAPDETGFSKIDFVFSGIVEAPRFNAGWGVGIKNDDGTYTTVDAQDWGACSWDDSTGVTVFSVDFDKKWDATQGTDLYELAKAGKVYGFIMEHPVGQEEDGYINANDSPTLIKATGNYAMSWNANSASYGACVKATADGAAETGDALLAVVAVVVAASAGIVLVKKH